MNSDFLFMSTSHHITSLCLAVSYYVMPSHAATYTVSYAAEPCPPTLSSLYSSSIFTVFLCVSARTCVCVGAYIHTCLYQVFNFLNMYVFLCA